MRSRYSFVFIKTTSKPSVKQRISFFTLVHGHLFSPHNLSRQKYGPICLLPHIVSSLTIIMYTVDPFLEVVVHLLAK